MAWVNVSNHFYSQNCPSLGNELCGHPVIKDLGVVCTWLPPSPLLSSPSSNICRVATWYETCTKCWKVEIPENK